MKQPASLKAASEAKDDDSISKSVPTFLVDPRTIVVQKGFNARPLDPEHVAYFKALKRQGVDTGFVILQMIDGKPTMREGHHRLAADLELIAEGCDIRKIKAMEFKGDEKAAIFLMLATQSGKVYTPLQVGEQYVKLINLFGLSYAEIAEQRGMSAQHVKDCIRLTEQPTELKTMIETGQVKAATALKLVKNQGATEAVKTLKSVKPKASGKGITQKDIDNAAKNVVPEAQKRAAAARDHIAAMLDSPNFDGPTKSVLSDALALVTNKTHRIPPPTINDKMELSAVRKWLLDQKGSEHSGIKRAAHLLHAACCGEKIPDDNSGSAQFYAHMVWLQDMAATSKEPTFRAAAHWFMAVLNAKRKGGELAPAPSVLSVEDALRAEMDSGGAVMAETLCPEQAALIAWVRGRA